MTTKRTDCYAAISNYIEDNVFNLLPRQFDYRLRARSEKSIVTSVPQDQIEGMLVSLLYGLTKKKSFAWNWKTIKS